MKCSKCGAELREGATFCTKCGAPIQTPKQQPRVETPKQQPQQAAFSQQQSAAVPQPEPAAPKKKKRTALWITLCAVLLIAGAVAALALTGTLSDWFGGKDADDDREEAATERKEEKETKETPVPEETLVPDGYEIAFITDIGPLMDHSYNEATWEGVKRFADETGKSYKYYVPANGDMATDDDRYDAMINAAENGAQVIVATGFMQGDAMERAAQAYPDVKFLFIDGWAMTDLDNVAGTYFAQEQCGYLAGYAAVMEGYQKLGFCGGGGGMNPAVNRYGYGFVQGAEAAAAEKGIDVEVKYSYLYGASFQPSAELQEMVNGWYEQGTEVIYTCGGSMFDSVTAAAAANDAKVIGVDIDQSYDSPTVITSSILEYGNAAYLGLKAAFGSDWNRWGGSNVGLGAAEGCVGLPVDTWSMKNWTVDDYEALLEKMADGSVTVDDDYDNLDSTAHVRLMVIE